MEFTLYFYPNNEDSVKQLALDMGDNGTFIDWFNRETDEGVVTVVSATNPDAYILAHNALMLGILIGYDVSR